MTPPSSPIRPSFDIPYETGYPPAETEKDKASKIVKNILSE